MRNWKEYQAIARVNFRHTAKAAYLTAAVLAVVGIADFIVDAALGHTGDMNIPVSSFLYILCLLAPVLFASAGYGKMMNLGVRKKAYLCGCILNYACFAAALSVAGALEHYLVDLPLRARGYNVVGLLTAFHWDTNVLSALFCPFAFLMLAQAVLHTLTFMQTKWYGWAADALIVVTVSVFTPIPALRQVEAAFFHAIIFAKPAIWQVFTCLALSALVYASNLIYLKQRC